MDDSNFTIDGGPLTSLAGMVGCATCTVTHADTAIALGSGDMAVLATPRLIALMEQAACAALSGLLAPAATSVGIRIEIRHTWPSAVGMQVTATARVVEVSGARITFIVAAADDERGIEIGSGTHVRALVDRHAFLAAVDDS